MITKVDLNTLSDYIPLAKRSNLVFCDNTDYYAMYRENEIVAFCGVLKYKNKWVFKNEFTLEEHRGNGYHKQLMNFRIRMAKELGVKRIEATCTKMSINNYIKYGFKVIHEYKNYKKLRLNL